MLAKTIFWNNRICLASTKSPTLIVWDIIKSKQQIFCGNILLLLNSCTWVILYTALYPVTLHFMYYCKWFPYFIISWYWTLILLSEIQQNEKVSTHFQPLWLLSGWKLTNLWVWGEILRRKDEHQLLQRSKHPGLSCWVFSAVQGNARKGK